MALENGQIHLYHTDSGLLLSAIDAHPGSPVRAITINGGNQLVSVADDRLIKGWDMDRLDARDALAWTLEVSEDDGVDDAEVGPPNPIPALPRIISPATTSSNVCAPAPHLFPVSCASRRLF